MPRRIIYTGDIERGMAEGRAGIRRQSFLADDARRLSGLQQVGRHGARPAGSSIGTRQIGDYQQIHVHTAPAIVQAPAVAGTQNEVQHIPQLKNFFIGGTYAPDWAHLYWFIKLYDANMRLIWEKTYLIWQLTGSVVPSVPGTDPRPYMAGLQAACITKYGVLCCVFCEPNWRDNSTTGAYNQDSISAFYLLDINDGHVRWGWDLSVRKTWNSASYYDVIADDQYAYIFVSASPLTGGGGIAIFNLQAGQQPANAGTMTDPDTWAWRPTSFDSLNYAVNWAGGTGNKISATAKDGRTVISAAINGGLYNPAFDAFTTGVTNYRTQGVINQGYFTAAKNYDGSLVETLWYDRALNYKTSLPKNYPTVVLLSGINSTIQMYPNSKGILEIRATKTQDSNHNVTSTATQAFFRNFDGNVLLSSPSFAGAPYNQLNPYYAGDSTNGTFTIVTQCGTYSV